MLGELVTVRYAHQQPQRFFAGLTQAQKDTHDIAAFLHFCSLGSIHSPLLLDAYKKIMRRGVATHADIAATHEFALLCLRHLAAVPTAAAAPVHTLLRCVGDTGDPALPVVVALPRPFVSALAYAGAPAVHFSGGHAVCE